MKLPRKLLFVIVAASPLALANNASAQWGYGGYGGYGFGGFWDIGRLYGVLADNVPYYAAFPPVYYSYPVPRTYGYSPFAYPPGYTTPDVAIDAPPPLAVNNPYTEKKAEDLPSQSSDAVDRTAAAAAPTPLVIYNPYVSSAVASSRAVDSIAQASSNAR
ncbi:MAG: hypothetical protein AAF961_04410 [Planctomycetota bacterium]